MKKNRFNTYLDEDLSKKMTAAMELCDAGSESEFIRNAVEYYISYIYSTSYITYDTWTIYYKFIMIGEIKHEILYGRN